MMSWYFRAPASIQSAALSVYGYRLQKIRRGGEHAAILSDILQSQWWDEDRLAALQCSLVNDLLGSAKTVPFLQDRGISSYKIETISDIRHLPFTTKDDLRQSEEQITSRSNVKTKVVDLNTGGTTGTPLKIFADTAALRRNYAFFDRLRVWAGVQEGSTATFAGRTIVNPSQSKPPYWRYNRAAKTLLCSSYHLGPKSAPAYLDELSKFAPALIDSYPSAIEVLARAQLSYGKSLVRPKAIITSAETLHPEVREMITEAFQCPIFDYYGATEMAAFISQCEYGSYHVNPEFGVVEILDGDRPVDAGELGEVVATGFCNHRMPLIRYRTGDLASWHSDTCQCGRAFRVISKIEGRMDDIIVTPDGRHVGRLDPIFKSTLGLLETRITQDRLDHLLIEAVQTDEFTTSAREKLLSELQNRVGPEVTLDFVAVTEFERTSRGKFRSVVSLI